LASKLGIELRRDGAQEATGRAARRRQHVDEQRRGEGESAPARGSTWRRRSGGSPARSSDKNAIVRCPASLHAEANSAQIFCCPVVRYSRPFPGRLCPSLIAKPPAVAARPPPDRLNLRGCRPGIRSSRDRREGRVLPVGEVILRGCQCGGELTNAFVNVLGAFRNTNG
jgi:hypothetical protein